MKYLLTIFLAVILANCLIIAESSYFLRGNKGQQELINGPGVDSNELLKFVVSYLDKQDTYQKSSEVKRADEEHDIQTRDYIYHQKRHPPIRYDGYTLDINIDLFKSLRSCQVNEICKKSYRNHFECICPFSTLCVANSHIDKANCMEDLKPYIWVQSAGDSAKIRPKL